MKVPGLRLIELASRIVPRNRRGAWRREWEGETTFAWQRMSRAGAPSVLARTRLGLRVLTCVFDAMLEKKEDVRMAGFANDLRYALRSLVRNPVFTAVAILTLALGIGVNTAVFTLVDGVLIRPLPFGEPQELLSIQHLGRDGQDEPPISPGLYLLYKEQVSNLEAIAMYAPSERTMLVEGQPERVPVQVVTPSFFDVLGIPPAQGRAFLSEEESPGSEPVVILSHGFWQRSFGGDPGVLDQTVRLSGITARVVGVMPRVFGYPDRESQSWIPLEVEPAQAPLASFGAFGVARMAQGSTLEGVEA